jgi:hypothetical protein
MKKWLLSFTAFILMNSSIAANTNAHFYPQVANNEKLELSSPCLIKITNDSQYDILITGVFDDGSPLSPFIIYAYEQPQFISLFYYNICHGIMNIGIETTSGLKLYQQETYVNSRIRIKSGWLNPYVIFEKTRVADK